MAAPAAPKEKPSFDPRNLMEIYLRRQYDELSEKFLSILGHFHDTTYFSVDEQTQYFINAFVKQFLNLFTQADYILSEKFVQPFLQLNVTISNLVAISDFKTTDAYLEMLRRQEANFIKILTLLSVQYREVQPPGIFRRCPRQGVALVQRVFGDLRHGARQRTDLQEPAGALRLPGSAL